MPNPNFLLLHVDSPAASAAFYETLLGHPPVETSPTFVMFALKSGIMLGLWSRHTVEPESGAVGASELAFTVADEAAVEDAFADWKRKDVAILMEPVTMDFGRTFVAADPDGHRLRVFAPGQ
jgi:catechol 2,3-dioxygenase-like lactoylglutathione lyase family enzyme